MSMEQFLLQLALMSIRATIIIFVILLVRYVFSKWHIARKYIVLLWMIPYFAMIMPFVIETPFSFWTLTYEEKEKVEAVVNTMPYVLDTVTTEPVSLPEEERYSPPTALEESNNNRGFWSEVESALTHIFEGLTLYEIHIQVIFAIWVSGVSIFLVKGIWDSIRLQKRLVCSREIAKGIFETDGIKEPFVYGMIRPKIYLPVDMTEESRVYVVEHEKTHILRKDCVTKFVAYLIGGIHWFNPVIRCAFHLLAKDMEMACDEETVKKIGLEKRQDYALALVDLASRKQKRMTPLAFSEGDVKSRVKNIVNYKKNIGVMSLIALLVTGLLAVCFLTSPKEKYRILSDIEDDEMVVSLSGLEAKEMMIIYHGKEHIFPVSFYDSFCDFLEDLEVKSKAIDRSRSEDRPADIVIGIKDGTVFMLDDKAEHIWCNNGVKPSFTYEIRNPKMVFEFLDKALWELEEISVDENVTEINIYNYLGDKYADNYPYLLYADGTIVRFYNDYWYFQYDLDNQTVEQWKVSDIYPGSKEILPNYVNIEDVELIEEDYTVFRTKECIQISENKYVYLQSGSGLLVDLYVYVVASDQSGVHTEVYEIFKDYSQEGTEFIPVKK